MVNEYESGKAIPNQQVMGKLERNLGIYNSFCSKFITRIGSMC